MINALDNIDCVPSNVQFSHQEAFLCVFEDNEAVIKMITKGRSPTMRHVSRTHRVALDWLFDRVNLDPKIQIKYTDTKNQLADILTNGNFTRDEWNHLLNLFNISHFSSTVCSVTMAKRLQQDSGGERVTAKSRPMMNLIARTPSFVSSSTSVSPVKKHNGSQDPWKSVAGEDRSGRPGKETDLFEASDHYYHEQFMESFSSTDYSKLDYDRAYTTQIRKKGIAERAVRRVKEGTSAVLLQAGLNEHWWADSMECYTYLRNLQDLLSDEKTPCERRIGKPFKGPIIPFGSLVEYYPFSAKDQSRIHQYGKKVLPGLFLVYALYAGGIWKGDVLVADLEELELMDASEIYSKRLNVRILPKRKWKIHVSSRRWTNHISWKRSGPENIHFDTGTSNSRRKSR